MPDASATDAPVDVEPKDRRTTEWKAWRDRQRDAGIHADGSKAATYNEADVAAQTGGTLTESVASSLLASSAPPAPAGPPNFPPQAVPAVRSRKILPPDEFLTHYICNNPKSVQDVANGQPNPEASIISSCMTAYSSYLAMLSPAYASHLKQTLPPERARVLPDCGVLDAMYDVAMGQ